jgi:hypothetical protein
LRLNLGLRLYLLVLLLLNKRGGVYACPRRMKPRRNSASYSNLATMAATLIPTA